jgi:hypothetical protein
MICQRCGMLLPAGGGAATHRTIGECVQAIHQDEALKGLGAPPVNQHPKKVVGGGEKRRGARKGRR